MTLQFRPLLNWIFPPFKPIEIALLAELKSALVPEAASILAKRIATVNLVQRNFDETNLYHVRCGKVKFDSAGQFPLRVEEVRLATIKFKVPGSEKVFTSIFWLVNGFLFSFETVPGLSEFLNSKRIHVQSISLHCDPMGSEPSVERDTSAFIALGSNVGDSSRTIEEAMSWMEGLTSKPLRKSSFWQTSPVDCPPGSPPFINAVVALAPKPGETPESLLEKLRQIEREFGRLPKKVLNEPRPLDLDLIAFDEEVRSSAELTLPHPRAHLRKFVLAPLAEIAPDLILPGQTQTVLELLNGLTSGESIRKWR